MGIVLFSDMWCRVAVCVGKQSKIGSELGMMLSYLIRCLSVACHGGLRMF